MIRYVRLIVGQRVAVLLVLALLTAVAGWSLSRAVVASSIGQMFLGEDPAYHRFLDRVRAFGGGDPLIVAIEDAMPLAPENQARLRQAMEAIAAVEHVRLARSILDVQRVRGDADALRVDAYADLAARDPAQADTLMRELVADPLGAGLLVAGDGKSHAVIIELDLEADRPAEEGPIIIAAILGALTDAGYDRAKLHAAGFPANVAAIISETHFNLKRLLPFVVAILLATVWLMFRRLWPVALTMIVAVVATIWTMGFAVALDPHINALTSMIPAVILIISFSDVIHLSSAYLLELGRGRAKDEAIHISAVEVGRACLLTSVTTFLGFVAMSFVPAPAFRVMGLVLGFGVGTALLLAVTLTPVLFSLVPAPRPWRLGATGALQNGLDRVLDTIHRATNRRPWWFVAGFAALTIVSIAGVAQFRIETDFAKRLSEDHPTRLAGQFVQEHFAGSTAVEIFIDSGETEGLLNPDLIRRVAALEHEIETLPGVGAAFSLVDLLETMHGEMTGEAGLPPTRAALAQYLLLFEASGGADLDRLVDFNRQTMRLVAQTPEGGVRETAATGRKIAAAAQRHLGTTAQVDVLGLVNLMGAWLDEIVTGQLRGLLFAILTIGVIMVLGLRSWRVGLWSMIPNLLPLLVLAGYLGWTRAGVDSDVMGVAMIAIGIGVDDTIHFLSRLRTESARGVDPDEALERTMYFSGRGIVITTVILVAGFSPFLFSDYLSTQMMGTLLPLTLIVALAADLLFVPALVRLGAIRYRFDRTSREGDTP
jgi:uncharacterized protein